MLQLVLDVEVGRVIEDGDNLAVGCGAIGSALLLVVAIGRDGDGVERHGLGGLRGDFGHVCDVR